MTVHFLALSVRKSFCRACQDLETRPASMAIDVDTALLLIGALLLGKFFLLRCASTIDGANLYFSYVVYTPLISLS
jgi:hypothetical protein